MICYESRQGRHYIGGQFVKNDGRYGNYRMISDRWLHGANIEEDDKILKLFYSSIPKDGNVKTCKVFHLPAWQNPNVFCHVAPVLMNRRRRIGRADTPDNGNSKRLKREPYPFQTFKTQYLAPEFGFLHMLCRCFASTLLRLCISKVSAKAKQNNGNVKAKYLQSLSKASAKRQQSDSKATATHMQSNVKTF